MAQTSWPFENIDTTETQFSQWSRNIGEGVKGLPSGTELKPYGDASGMNVKVPAGQALVRGHYYANDAIVTLTVSSANSTNPRIDYVVLELDPVANTIVLKVLGGTAGVSPVAPSLTQTDSGVYQLPLATVYVAAAVTNVAANAVTDVRTFIGKRLQSVGNSAARDIVFPSPAQGDMVWRDDKGALETYFNAYNITTNPGGVGSGGWFRNTEIYPRMISYSSSTSAASFGGASDYTIITASVDIIPGHKYRVTGRANFQSAGTSGNVTLRVTSSSVTRPIYYQSEGVGTNLNLLMHGSVIISATEFGVTTTPTTITANMIIPTGSGGTLVVNPDAVFGANTTPHQLTFEDLGNY